MNDFYAREFWRFVLVQQQVGGAGQDGHRLPADAGSGFLQPGRGQEADRRNDQVARRAVVDAATGGRARTRARRKAAMFRKTLSKKEWHHSGCAVQNQKVAFVIFGGWAWFLPMSLISAVVVLAASWPALCDDVSSRPSTRVGRPAPASRIVAPTGAPTSRAANGRRCRSSARGPCCRN